MGGPHYYITYYYYRRAIVFFCDTAGLWRRGAAWRGVAAIWGYANIWYMRVPLFSRCGGGGALLQIAPIGTYTMSYYPTARAEVNGGGWWQQQAAGDRFCSGYLLLLGVKVRM